MSKKNNTEVEVVTITLKKTGVEKEVFLEDFNTMAKAIDYAMTCTNWDAFFNDIADLDSLKKFKATAIAEEKYEFAALIQKHIRKKSKKKK